MKMMKLIRQNHLEPDMKILEQMREYIETLYFSHFHFSPEEWNEVVHQLVAFQADDGSFNLLDSNSIESDCAVYYCYEPTYLGTAILMRAFLINKDLFTGKEDIILGKAMHACCARQLNGHGYKWLRDKINAIYYFMDCDVKLFIEQYPYICPEFNAMFDNVKQQFSEMESKEQFIGDFGENFRGEILDINSYFSSNAIFVYGTLMKGQSNHNRFLEDGEFVGNGKIKGYEMYDLGYFPGIVEGNGDVHGEVYFVSDSRLMEINRLEGEGDLYIKTCVNVVLDSGEKIAASAYVYNHDVTNCKMLNNKYGSEEYVWYVTYGSNLLEERLGFYIQGGYCSYNNREYSPCSDVSMPIDKCSVTIPYDMYYSNFNMGSWKNSAVCFLDLSHKGMSYGRAYKIKKSQLNEIHMKEGNSVHWYPDCIRLDDIDGLEAYTFAGYDVRKKEPFSRVSAEYGIVLFNGMKECYPEMSDKEIFDYLKQR